MQVGPWTECLQIMLQRVAGYFMGQQVVAVVPPYILGINPHVSLLCFTSQLGSSQNLVAFAQNQLLRVVGTCVFVHHPGVV